MIDFAVFGIRILHAYSSTSGTQSHTLTHSLCPLKATLFYKYIFHVMVQDRNAHQGDGLGDIPDCLDALHSDNMLIDDALQLSDVFL